MDVSSAQQICLQLVSSAFQRCRLSEDHCRLSVVINLSPATHPPVYRISISDTGLGCSLEEFQNMKYTDGVSGSGKWDGVLSVKTTCLCDDEIYYYQINLKGITSNSRLTRLPSRPKNGVKFSGTEVHLHTSESTSVLLAEITRYYQKVLVLKTPNIAMDLSIERGDVPGSQYEHVFLANECDVSLFLAPSIERLKSGLEDFVLKHGNSLSSKCDSCFLVKECLKVGSGTACYAEGHKSAGLMVEVVIIINESFNSTIPCCSSDRTRTQVLYFKDFTPSSIHKSSLNALAGVDWKSYGLTLLSATDERGCALLEWGNLPPNAQIHVVLHCYHNQIVTSPAKQKAQPHQILVKKAVKQALDDLKEKHEGSLLSAHALKICSYAPDLAKTIAGLIFSSNDSQFQGKCLSLLGLQSEADSKFVEDCIKEKIVSVIQTNDKKAKTQEVAAPFLFEDECTQELYFEDEEYAFSSFD